MNLFCYFLGHKPYVINGTYTDWDIVPDETPLKNTRLSFVMYVVPKELIPPKRFCLACGKDLTK